MVFAWPLKMLPDGLMIPDIECGTTQRFIITDIGATSAFFVVPCFVTNTEDYRVVYQVNGAAMPILQYAIQKCLAFVAHIHIAKLFQYMNWPLPSGRDQQLGKLIEGFGDEFGMSLTDRARCFQKCHRISAKMLNDCQKLFELRKNGDYDGYVGPHADDASDDAPPYLCSTLKDPYEPMVTATQLRLSQNGFLIEPKIQWGNLFRIHVILSSGPAASLGGLAPSHATACLPPQLSLSRSP